MAADDAFPVPDEIKRLIEKLIRQIWKNKAMPADIDKAITEFFASQYWQAIEEGYGQQLSSVDLDSVDYTMLRRLEENVYQFSAAKNYQQLLAMSRALIDEEGKLRTFTQFRTAAAAINNQFINQWLRAEYNFAVASGQSAAQWQRIEETKDVLPLLQYKTAEDERVRLAHQELEDVIRPVNDNFWDVYYPPNGWNCRCDVIQLDSGKITPMDKISLPGNMHEIFKYNAGKRGIAFPPGHPYYDGLPPQVKEDATNIWIDKRVNRNGDTE